MCRKEWKTVVLVASQALLNSQPVILQHLSQEYGRTYCIQIRDHLPR